MRLLEPYMGAAYNLARWLLRDEMAAQDMVQESYMRAFTALDKFDGSNPKAWLLAIVRNRCYSWLKKNAAGGADIRLDDDLLNPDEIPELSDHDTPEHFAINAETKKLLKRALDDLPPIFREAFILKELEELSYKEIASITQVPIGTVMSRLARGRTLLKSALGKLDSP